LVEGFKTDPDLIDSYGDLLLVRTNQDAPNFKVVLIDPSQPDKNNWKIVIPEQQEVLQSVGTGGGYLFCSYLRDASTRVVQFTYTGKVVREINLPGLVNS